MRDAVALALACLPALALADGRGADKAIDATAVVDKLDVYRDELDNFYVLPRRGAFGKLADADKWLFFGDGKKLYQQRVIGSGDSGGMRDWTVWAPRAKHMTGARIEVGDYKSVLICQSRDKDSVRALVPLAADEAKTLLARAKLYPVLWQREAHLLARDDDGVYYYVDNLREEFGGNGYRVFVGMKGAMKEMAMTNIVRDSSGEIFATKTGQLKLVTGKAGSAYWIKGGKKSELTIVDVQADRYLIYRDLGIYGQLGAVCDDF